MIVEPKRLLAIDELRRRSRSGRIVSGVYFLFFGEELIYIGKSKNVAARIATHTSDPRMKFNRYAVVRCPENELDSLEEAYIALYTPKENGCFISQRIRNGDVIMRDWVLKDYVVP